MSISGVKGLPTTTQTSSNLVTDSSTKNKGTDDQHGVNTARSGDRANVDAIESAKQRVKTTTEVAQHNAQAEMATQLTEENLGTPLPPKKHHSIASMNQMLTAQGQQESDPCDVAYPSPSLDSHLRHLSPADRQQVVDLVAQIGDASLQRDLTELVASTAFTALGADTKSGVLRELARHPQNAYARKIISDLACKPGFAKMEVLEQDKLLRYIGGSNYEVSQNARGILALMLRDPSFFCADPEDQAQKLEVFVQNQVGLAGTMKTQPEAFDKVRRNYTIGAPVEIANHRFSSGVDNALRYPVEIDGRTIPVYLTQAPPVANLQIHTIEDVAKALAAQPKASRALIKRVNVNRAPNPQDCYWARKYNNPGFSSYMTACKSGEVNIYPSKEKSHQGTMDGTMLHEAGHIYSGKTWGSVGSPKWNAWKLAVESDRFVPTQYAKVSLDEDFSESIQLYYQVKGKPAEKELRALMPERFKILDRITKQ